MWRLEYAVALLPYTKIAPMMQCAMGAIYTVMHVYCTYFYYSHSIIANLKYMLYRVILLLLFQEVPCRANHFVIGRGDYKMRFLLPFHLICDYSLATTPIFTKGSGHRWFSTGARCL